jgi:hypothetical protein
MATRSTAGGEQRPEGGRLAHAVDQDEKDAKADTRHEGKAQVAQPDRHAIAGAGDEPDGDEGQPEPQELAPAGHALEESADHDRHPCRDDGGDGCGHPHAADGHGAIESNQAKGPGDAGDGGP